MLGLHDPDPAAHGHAHHVTYFAAAGMETPSEEDDARGIHAVLLDDGSAVEFVDPVALDRDGMLGCLADGPAGAVVVRIG